jgi:hypothetical protein
LVRTYVSLNQTLRSNGLPVSTPFSQTIIAQSLASMTAETPARSGVILGYGGAHYQEVRDLAPRWRG